MGGQGQEQASAAAGTGPCGLARFCAQSLSLRHARWKCPSSRRRHSSQFWLCFASCLTIRQLRDQPTAPAASTDPTTTLCSPDQRARCWCASGGVKHHQPVTQAKIAARNKKAAAFQAARESGCSGRTTAHVSRPQRLPSPMRSPILNPYDTCTGLNYFLAGHSFAASTLPSSNCLAFGSTPVPDVCVTRGMRLPPAAKSYNVLM